MTKYENKRNKMFFVVNNNNVNEQTTKDIAIQQILDTLHVWAVHSLRINIKKYFVNKNDSDGDEDEKFDMSCIDNTLNNIGNIITEARESSNRYRSVMDSRTNANNLKFTTTNDVNKSLVSKIDEK
eukprot:234265_1